MVSDVGSNRWPTMTFVALGLDHVIANMYFIPIAIFYGHPDIGVGMYIWKSLIPTTLGNTIGGGLFVGGIYWYLYLTGPGSEDIKFDLGGLDTAMEAGGPMGPSRHRSVPNSQSSQDEKDIRVIDSKEPEEGHPNHVHSLPSTDRHMASGIGRELSAEAYTHKKGEAAPIVGQKV